MRKRLLAGLIIPVVIGIAFSSCTPLKDIVYIPEAVTDTTQAALPQPDAYRIQPYDNLYIQVISSDEFSMYFNISTTDRYLNNDAAIELGSYRVNKQGEIDFPYIGKVKVAGLTTEEIKEVVNDKISESLVEFSVVVKHVNRHFTLLGEVGSPGTYTFYKDYLTIFEALGYGRDLTDFGNRHKVKIIRHTQKGKLIETFDLTKNDILSSNFYYILPNDIIYVEPNTKVWGAKTLPFTAILTTINTAVLLYNAINNAVGTN
ncbi:MAG: polysaccharide biosynthesis/export family protein [Prolixibacteraceae bacterium]|nr:polysaccharide biosynthesis/export family protein [Prolixibacteraceae bacterium]